MPLSFPSSPINGAVSGDYTYDASKGAWRKNGAYPVSVTHSDVAPSNPRVGDQWWKSNEGTLFTYYYDGNSYQWVESTNVIANVEPNPIPAGAMMAWASNTIPANWLLCDGAAVSRSTYASLFAIIGTQYGSGDGSTTFNLPNIKGKTIVGRDSADSNFDILNTPTSYVGAKTHTLTEAQIPSHTHTYSGTTSTTGSHNHINGWASITGYNYVGSGGNSTWPFGGGSNAAQRDLQAAGDHAHTFSGTTAATGSGQAHNNLQPYIVLNYIIKYSAGETPGDSQLAARVGAIETSTIRSVALGGTGVSSLTSGAYLKGAGTSAITAQTGVPAADITSGQLSSARMPPGSVIQVVQTNFTTRSSQSYSNSTVTDITGLSATITPISTNSRIMAFVRWFGELSPGDAPYNTVFGLKRNGTRVGEGTDNGSTVVTAITAPALSYEGTDVSSTAETMSFFYVDSPATTSAITYQVFFIANVGAGSAVIAHNKTYNWSGQSTGFELGTSNITLMEIA